MNNKIIAHANYNPFTDIIGPLFKDQSQAPAIVVAAIKAHPKETRKIVSDATSISPDFILEIVREAVETFTNSPNPDNPNTVADIVYGAVCTGISLDRFLKPTKLGNALHFKIFSLATDLSPFHFRAIIAAVADARRETTLEDNLKPL